MKTQHKIIIGDARYMDAIRNNEVQLVVTSPPYWQLKDYGKGNQIGYHDSYEFYINNLNLVWKECYRVLENGCRLCINIGDQFARSVYYGRYKVIPIRTEIIKFCETIGFDYMGAIIWKKVTTTHTSGGATIMGSFPYPRNGILKINYEFILIFKKGGKVKRVEKDRKEKSRLTIKEWNSYFSGHWNFPGEKQRKNMAIFPLELPSRLIKMFTYCEDTILDPFLGSGTSCLAAKKLNRNSIGYEINEEYLPIIRQKLGVDDTELFNQAEFIFEKQRQNDLNIEMEILQLPYIFKDPVKIGKKTGPRKTQLASRSDKKYDKNEELYSVKRVLAPDLLELKDGPMIKLLGVKINEEKRNRAIDFLETKTKSQKVFFKFDRLRYDKDKNLLCYLYLKNRTFLNAHLIKNGLADVENRFEYKYFKQFQKYRGNADD
jgi:DNA modification methylase